MSIRLIVAAATLAAIALPIAVLASNPQAPQKRSLDAARVLSLLLDPYEETGMQVTLPQGHATLDVDADPFKG